MARYRYTPFAVVAVALFARDAFAQGAAAPADATRLDTVTVTGRTAPPVGVAGWGDVPLTRLPLQATVVGSERLKDDGVQRLSDLTARNPSIGDAYNAEGYWDFLSVRGFVLDNRFNYRRDGLPISAETSIPLDNKARIEILEGTSGLQAGISAPGGLVNHVIKRPTDSPLRTVFVEWRQPGTVTGALDIGQRFGEGQAFGLRVNAAAARLDPMVRSSRGERSLLAVAGDWRIGTGTLLEAEIETSHRSQPSQPGFSLLGNHVPEPADPRLSLNNQPWSQPVVFDATTASLRWQQALGAGWTFVAHGATQQLRTDDRLAFPFGCSAADGTYYADRFCPDGTFDLYDFRSDGERRRTDAADLSVQGRFAIGGVGHAVSVGVLHSRVRNRFGGEAYNFAGTGTVDGSAVTPPAPDLFAGNTDRDERSTEWYARDAVALTDRFTAWLGLRHTRLQRRSALTDGSQPTAYGQSVDAPSLALSYALGSAQHVYASWGRGVQSEVVPNLPVFANRGQALPALRSRQVELGLKGESDLLAWSVAAFDIVQPKFSDFGSCAEAGETGCLTRAVDGTQHHRGLEARMDWHGGPWTLSAGGQWLRARLEGGQSSGAAEGARPTNVPARTLRLQIGREVAAVPGLHLQAALSSESSRIVLPDNSVSIPGWTRVDTGLRYERRTDALTSTWRVGIDNLFDRRAWRESPYQFSHAYLYALAPRTVRLSAEFAL